MLFKNISFSLFYKILTMVLSLIIVPLLINTLGTENYGVWVALTSLIAWISLFDFGLGYALKNTVTTSIANNKLHLAKAEALQVLKLTCILSVLLLIVFFCSISFISVLKLNLGASLMIFVPFILLFPLKAGNAILQGARLIALESGFSFIGPLFFFIFSTLFVLFGFCFDVFTAAVLFTISYVASIICIWLKACKVVNISLFDFRELMLAKLDFSRISVGVKFFVLQVASLVLYSVGTILVYDQLGPQEAAHYDVVSKIFVLGLSLFNMVIAAFWPEITNYFSRSDFNGIKTLYLRMIFLSLIFSLGSFFVAYFAPEIVSAWTIGKINISKEQAIFFGALVSIQSFAYSGAVVLNALEKMNVQLVLTSISVFLMMPLSMLFFSNNYGISSVPLAAAILTIPAMLYANTHTYILIRTGLLNAKAS
ncbi:oligosaccharide flippase family protein [Shewanella holmiensis]|uniref:Oligosaccharide flippase family protein n=1 Tax=Shewanella holmiensis TaxID=2952222 RepID=A0A9X3AX61_9GAMM|nr:oligosaccharide flippase family protein [Shewanella holmiensis]MCT7942948.1 oligosaccharide flippase family protein [Shewanella holmiensis]